MCERKAVGGQMSVLEGFLRICPVHWDGRAHNDENGCRVRTVVKNCKLQGSVNF